MIYGSVYLLVNKYDVKNMVCEDGGYWSADNHQQIGEEYEVIVLDSSDPSVERPTSCKTIKMPTYMYVTAKTRIETQCFILDDPYTEETYFTSDETFKERVRLIGASMLKQCDTQCEWVSPPLTIKAAHDIYRGGANIAYTFTSTLCTTTCGKNYLQMDATAVKTL